MHLHLAFAAAFVFAAAAAAQMRSIPLTVQETAGVNRRLDTVTAGVPVPRDAHLTQTDPLRLLTAQGREVNAQFRVLSRWYATPDDATAPIRWILVDFQAHVPANGSAQFEIRNDAPPGPVAHPIEVTKSSDGIVVSTGAARFQISTERFNLFDGVDLDLDGDGLPTDRIVPTNSNGGVVVMRSDGSLYLSAQDEAPTSVEIEEAGSIRTVIRVDGRLHTQTQNGAYPDALDYLEYTARYHFLRGKSDVRLEFTLRNPDRALAVDYHAGGDPVFHSFQELSLHLPVRLQSATSFTTIGDDVLAGPISNRERVQLYQDSSGGPNWGPSNDSSPYWSTTFQGYRVTHGDGPQAPILGSGLRALGLGDLSDGRAGVAASLRDFWQNFPKGIRLIGLGAIDVELYPGRWAALHTLRGGIQKTHDILFQFHAGSAIDADVQSDAIAFQYPLRALASPETYRDSGALGPISTEDPKAFRDYEEALTGILDYQGNRPEIQGTIYRELEEKDEYGWLNWGDHYRAGDKNLRYWGNNEFDLSWILLLGYLRNHAHDDRFFQLAQASVRHLIDVDVYHTDRDIFWANRGMKKHDASGVIDHNRDPNLSHFWIDGLTTYYWLTGDEAARDTLIEIGQWLRNREEDPVDHPGSLAYDGEVRSKGWTLQALVGLFECLGDRAYFDLAQRMIPVEIAAVTSPEGWIPNSIGLVDPWMHGYVTEGLGRYLVVARSLGAPAAQARELFLQILGFQSTMAWSEEMGMMAYTWDPATHRAVSFSSNDSQTAVNGFAYAFLLTGGTDYLYWAQRCFDSYYAYRGFPYYYSITLQTPAKNAGFRMRFSQVYMKAQQTFPPDDDGRPPVIANVRAENVRWTDAEVRFETDEPADAQVVYWTEGGPHAVENQANFFHQWHVVPLRGLAGGTTYHSYVLSRDLAGELSISNEVRFRTWDPDTTPPVITNVAMSQSVEGMAVVRFDTDEPATGRVEFGLTGAYGQAADEESGARRTHEILVTVDPDTTYHFRVVASDVWGNSAASPDAIFHSGGVAVILAGFDGHLIANYGGNRVRTQGAIEVRDNAGLHYDGLLWFDLRMVPRGSSVLQATLQITKSGSGAWSPVIAVHGVLHTATSSQSGGPGIGFDPADPCYLYRDRSAAVSWTPGGGSADDAMGPVAAQFQVFRTENRPYLVDLTDLVQRWVSGLAPNEGLFLEVHGTGQAATFRSSEDADPTQRPSVRVLYRR